MLTYAGRTTRNDFANATWLTPCGQYQLRHSTFTLSAELTPKWYALKLTPNAATSTGTRWEIIGRHNARKAALRKLLAQMRADARLARRIERDAEIRKHKRRQVAAKQRRKQQRPSKRDQRLLF